MNLKKDIIIVTVVVVLIGAAGYWGGFLKNNDQDNREETINTPVPTTVSYQNSTLRYITIVPKKEEDLNIYKFGLGKFSLDLPKEWTIFQNFSTEKQERSELCPNSGGPLLVVDFNLNDNSKRGGGLSIEGTNKDTCLNRGLGYYGFLDDPAKAEYLYQKEISGYNVYFNVIVLEPGAPHLEAQVIGYNRGLFTYLWFSYSDNTLISTVMNIDQNTPQENCSKTNLHPLVGYFCKNGKIAFKKQIESSVSRFENLIASFKPL